MQIGRGSARPAIHREGHRPRRRVGVVARIGHEADLRLRRALRIGQRQSAGGRREGRACGREARGVWRVTDSAGSALRVPGLGPRPARLLRCSGLLAPCSLLLGTGAERQRQRQAQGRRRAEGASARVMHGILMALPKTGKRASCCKLRRDEEFVFTRCRRASRLPLPAPALVLLPVGGVVAALLHRAPLVAGEGERLDVVAVEQDRQALVGGDVRAAGRRPPRGSGSRRRWGCSPDRVMRTGWSAAWASRSVPCGRKLSSVKVQRWSSRADRRSSVVTWTTARQPRSRVFCRSVGSTASRGWCWRW